MDGIWAVLRDRLDYSRFVPRLVDDLERADHRSRAGTPYTVIKNPRGDRGAGRYLRLDAADRELLELMDGERTVSDILVEHLGRHGVFAIDRLARLTAALGANGFFGEERPAFYEKLRRRRAQRDPLTRLSSLLRRLIVWDIARWENAESAVDVAYRLGGRLLFTRLGAALMIAFSAFGLVLWAQEVRAPRHDLVSHGGSYVAGILILIVLQVLSISVHEAGHALAIRHYGRRVRRLGFAIYYLFPCFYVDATDMTLGSRRQRIVVSLAGPLGGVSVAAACAVVTSLVGDGLIAGLAFKAASLFVFQFVLNLLPILDLDGYHVLTDALDAPLLRERALSFARGRAIPKLRRRERWTSGEIGLALFGLSAIVVSLATLAFSLLLWQSRVDMAARELLASGALGALALGAIVLVFVGPLVLALAARAVALGRTSTRAWSTRRARERAADLEERIRVLDRVRFLNGLGRPALIALASHLRFDEVPAGAAVVRVGEPADRFYLVRAGRLEAVGPDGEPLSTIVPGEGFGELALLDRTTRTATVRAAEPSVLWSLDRGHFNRWVKDRYEVAARIRASRDERERLARLPFFRGVSAQELARVVPRMQILRFAGGADVFRAGDPGDRYYVIREGTARVTLPDGTAVRTLGPGDGFGELALLFGGGRTATVTATSDLVVATLARNVFADLVRASGETMGAFRSRTAHYVGAGLGRDVSRAF